MIKLHLKSCQVLSSLLLLGRLSKNLTNYVVRNFNLISRLNLFISSVHPLFLCQSCPLVSSSFPSQVLIFPCPAVFIYNGHTLSHNDILNQGCSTSSLLSHGIWLAKLPTSLEIWQWGSSGQNNTATLSCCQIPKPQVPHAWSEPGCAPFPLQGQVGTGQGM